MAGRQEPNYLTQAGYKSLQEELSQLRNVRRPDIAKRIHSASETGGTADNAEYEEAKEEQAFIEGRIQELERLLSQSVAAPKRSGKSETVVFGTTVTVVAASGKKQKYTMVGSAEAAPLEGKISIESPVGQALMGRKIGDEVEVKAPAGITKLTISQIQ
jgi:transcription elongation factor GreA